MALVGSEFMETLRYLNDIWLPARETVAEVISKRFEVDPSGRILLFLNGGSKWKEHLYSLETKGSPAILYCLHEGDSEWRIKCVPIEDGSFISRYVPKRNIPLSSNITDIHYHKNGVVYGVQRCRA